MSRLEAIAFARKDVKWQAAVRHADNYIVASKYGDAKLQEKCQNAFMLLVPHIRNG